MYRRQLHAGNLLIPVSRLSIASLSAASTRKPLRRRPPWRCTRTLFQVANLVTSLLACLPWPQASLPMIARCVSRSRRAAQRATDYKPSENTQPKNGPRARRCLARRATGTRYANAASLDGRMGRRVRKREGCKRCESAKGRLVPTLRVFVVRPSRLHEQARRLHHKLFLDRHEERRPREELPGNGPDRRVRTWSVASGSYPPPR